MLELRPHLRIYNDTLVHRTCSQLYHCRCIYFYLQKNSCKNLAWWIFLTTAPHTASIKPRGAGIIIVVCGIITTLAYAYLGELPYTISLLIITSFFVIGLLGLLDDKFHLSAKSRAIVHFVMAATCVFFLGGISNLQLGFFLLPLSLIGSVLAILALVWSTNLFNFMDGTDGIAGVEAITVLTVGGLLLLRFHAYDFATLLFILSAVIAGFLVWNWPNSSVFMGDVWQWGTRFYLNAHWPDC